MTLPGGKPGRGRYRGGRSRPQFDRYVVLRRQSRTLADQKGRTLSATKTAFALKAALERPDPPTGAAPSSVAAPVLDADGWKGWWTAATGIVYPPRPEAPPLSATAATPLIWRSRGSIGSAAWEAAEPFEARLAADARERGGSEGDATGTELATTIASFRFREANIRTLSADLGAIPVEWSLLDGEDVWDIVEAVSGWETGRYVDLRAVRRESARRRD